MFCLCGFDFANAVRHDSGEVRSYALIDSVNYVEFITAEHEAIASHNNMNQFLEKIGKSGRLAGQVLKCPSCGRLLVQEPPAYTPEFYEKARQ